MAYRSEPLMASRTLHLAKQDSLVMSTHELSTPDWLQVAEGLWLPQSYLTRLDGSGVSTQEKHRAQEQLNR